MKRCFNLSFLMGLNLSKNENLPLKFSDFAKATFSGRIEMKMTQIVNFQQQVLGRWACAVVAALSLSASSLPNRESYCADLSSAASTDSRQLSTEQLLTIKARIIDAFDRSSFDFEEALRQCWSNNSHEGNVVEIEALCRSIENEAANIFRSAINDATSVADSEPAILNERVDWALVVARIRREIACSLFEARANAGLLITLLRGPPQDQPDFKGAKHTIMSAMLAALEQT